MMSLDGYRTLLLCVQAKGGNLSKTNHHLLVFDGHASHITTFDLANDVFNEHFMILWPQDQNIDSLILCISWFNTSNLETTILHAHYIQVDGLFPILLP